jgi:DNA (cytosine-5)-methyltransferase 1
MGNGARDKSRRGLAGDRSGLVFEILDIVGFLQPAWVVVENVPALLISNGGRDIQAIIGALRQLGYLGFGRVLDAQYFGVPQKRRRLFLAAGLGRYPAWDFLADAGPMESLPCARGPGDWAGPGDGWAAYTLTAPDKLRGCNSRTNLKSELLIAEADGWDSMAERGRAVELHGLSQGLDAPNAEAAYAAGNAVPPPHCKMAG